MYVDILARPSGSALQLTLDRGERVTCEVGSMIAMSPGLSVETSGRQRGGGGLWAGVKRMVAGENYFLNHFTARDPEQTLILGPTMTGDIIHRRLTGETLIVQGSSWLASGPGVQIDLSFQGVSNALFSSEGVFWIKCSGHGDLFLNSFGAIYPVQVSETHVVDTGHVVAFEETLQFRVGKIGTSWLQTLLSGEGLVCHFSGQGQLYCQSHSPPSFGKQLGPMLKPR